MARPKKRPEELTDEYMGANPLMMNKEIAVRRVKELSEVNESSSMNRYALLETTPYTKLFESTNYKKNMGKLSVRGKELLLYLLHYIPAGKDYIWIDRKEYMLMNDIRSSNTFLSAVKELSTHPFYIYPHADLKDVFWINPLMFYKGNRLNKYPDNLSVKKYEKKKKGVEVT